MRINIGNGYELRDALDAISVHYFNAWMADYPAEEVGQYLVEGDYDTWQTGKYDVQLQTAYDWKPSRGQFLIWRAKRNDPNKEAKPKKA